MAIEDAVLALRRFGLGPRPGDVEQIAPDPRAALLAELAEPGVADLGGTELPGTADAYIAVRRDQQARQAERRTDGKGRSPAVATSADMAGDGTAAAASARPDDGPRLSMALYQREIDARLTRQLSVPIGFVERLVAFWANHFAVQLGKDEIVRGLAGPFEREAVRPFVLGRFEDMLLAATRHPAMLVSLDNLDSIGPDSLVGKRRDRGLNENHAREILELHTVGVDGGYDQADVTSLARILTGWSFVREVKKPAAGTFIFLGDWHEPGDHAVMGKTYVSNPRNRLANESQGREALHDLSHHPATARHVAGKLARHFVADDPPAALVDRLAAVFLDTDGNLKAVAAALLRSDEAWSIGRKFATPQQFVTSSLRALGLSLDAPRVYAFLRALGELPWNPPAPDGYHDDAATWLSPEAMTTRLDIADRLAQLAQTGSDPLALTRRILGPAVSRETIETVRRAESERQALTLMLMSPEFQWR